MYWPATFLAVAGFSAWRNIRTRMFQLGENLRFVPVWQNSCSDYSVLVKFTNFLRHCAQQKAGLAPIRWKIKLQCRCPISTNQRWAGKHCHIFQNSGSVLGMLTPSEAAQSFAVNLLLWYRELSSLVNLKVHCMLLHPNCFSAVHTTKTHSLQPGDWDRSVAPDPWGFSFAVQFVRFDLMQVHCEFNPFCRMNEENKGTALQQMLQQLLFQWLLWTPWVLVCCMFWQFQYFAWKHNLNSFHQ